VVVQAAQVEHLQLLELLIQVVVAQGSIQLGQLKVLAVLVAAQQVLHQIQVVDLVHQLTQLVVAVAVVLEQQQLVDQAVQALWCL
jgi:hypothetical protein